MTMSERKTIVLEQGWEFMQKGITKLKNILEGLSKQRFSSEDYMMLYTTIFTMCTQKPPHDYSEQLYEKYQDSYEEYITSMILPSLREKDGELLLTELVKRWANHKVMVTWLCRFFHYLDRYFITRRSLPSLNEVGLTCFRNLVYKELNGKVRDAVIYLIDRKREGKQIYGAQLKNVLDMFVEIGMGQMDEYENNFEAEMLKDTAAYYLNVQRETFVHLTKEEEKEVECSFNSDRQKVLVDHKNSNTEITGKILQCLRPGAWLNDEVINVYLELLKEREKRVPQKFLKCHFFSTFFYNKLISGKNGYDYKSVRGWTSQRKLGYSLIECDKIFVPIHKEIHWCLAVINKKEGKFQYLDSLGGKDNEVVEVLARYFVDEVKNKSGKDINVSSWKQEFVEDLPVQKNGFDCGMFMIKYADFYSRGLGLCFNQEHMSYFRKRTAKEIVRLRAN